MRVEKGFRVVLTQTHLAFSQGSCIFSDLMRILRCFDLSWNHHPSPAELSSLARSLLRSVGTSASAGSRGIRSAQRALTHFDSSLFFLKCLNNPKYGYLLKGLAYMKWSILSVFLNNMGCYSLCNPTSSPHTGFLPPHLARQECEDCQVAAKCIAARRAQAGSSVSDVLA